MAVKSRVRRCLALSHVVYANEPCHAGQVRHAEHLGGETLSYVDIDGIGSMTVKTDGEVPINQGETVYLSPKDGHLHVFKENRALQSENRRAESARLAGLVRTGSANSCTSGIWLSLHIVSPRPWMIATGDILS